MANYIANFISISSSSANEIRQVKEFVESDINRFDFSKIIPIEGDIPDKSCVSCSVFQRKFWGCYSNSWNHNPKFFPDMVLSRHMSLYKGSNAMHMVMYRFDTAWINCLPVIEALHDQFPNTNIIYFYADEPIATGVGEAYFGKGYMCHRKYEEGSKEAFELWCGLHETTPENRGYKFDIGLETYVFDEGE